MADKNAPLELAEAQNKLFEALKPHCSDGNQVDAKLALQRNKIEALVPLVYTVKLTKLLDYLVKSAKTRGLRGELYCSFIRDEWLVIREPGTGPTGYRTEVMVPVAKKGNACVTSGDNTFCQDQIDLVVQLYVMGKKKEVKDETEDANTPEEIKEALNALGVEVFLPTLPATEEDAAQHIASLWEGVAGYDEVKALVKQSITLPLVHRELFVRMQRLTHGDTPGGARLTAGVLFTGPPGVGKTTIARIAAHAANKPLVYVPVESIMSKWYGDAEQRLRKVFDLTRKLKRSVLFLDELDAFAGSRDGGGMHEATRRILSVLLRNLDGFEGCADKKKKDKDGEEASDDEEEEEGDTPFMVTVGATNRREDLDAALISRFDQSIDFPLPDDSERGAIFKRYAQHLSLEDREKLAVESPGFSGRDIVECCKQAERLWLFKILANGKTAGVPTVSELSPPPVDTYLESTKTRLVQCKQQQQCGKAN